MQDKYTADIGDFGKYGLLRALSREGLWGDKPASLGVAWWLVPDDDKKPDGRFTEYLGKPTEFEPCDKVLFNKLKLLVEGGRRRVSEVRAEGILRNARFFEKKLVFSDLSAASEAGRKGRLERRKCWVSEALGETKGCDIVFLDPDNGIEIPSTKKHHNAGPKYVFYEEMKPFVAGARVTIVYHHLCRHKKYGNHAKQIADRIAVLTGLSPRGSVFALRFNRYSARAFFFVLRQPGDEPAMCRLLRDFVAGAWGSCFDRMVYCGPGEAKT